LKHLSQIVSDHLWYRVSLSKSNELVSSRSSISICIVFPLCKEAKLQAGIKPTALCSVIDKENSIESPLDFTILYIQLLLWLCTLSPTVLMSVSWLLCHMLWLWLVTMCNVTILWLCDCYVIFPTLYLSNNLKEKKRKRKEI